jgi:hypothetical protein
VTLENCKTNEDGIATHEDCYVNKICAKESSGKSKDSSGTSKKTTAQRTRFSARP